MIILRVFPSNYSKVLPEQCMGSTYYLRFLVLTVNQEMYM